MLKEKAIKVFAPASVANIGVGYDIMGFPIYGPGDEILVRLDDKSKEFKITSIRGTGDKVLPKDIDKNTASYGAKLLLEDLGVDIGIQMEIHKKMPFGSGLGSSAASAVGGVFAVNELLGKPKQKEELIWYAMKSEEIADGAWHADNICASMMGGIVFIRDNEALDFIKLPVPKGLFVTIIYPEIEVLTKDARAILSDSVSLKTATKQMGNLGTFVSGLYLSEMSLLKRSFKDLMIEPQRKVLIPYFDDLQAMALKFGAFGYTISGAGPSMFALSDNTMIAEKIGIELQKFLTNKGVMSQSFVSAINTTGVHRM